MWLILLLAFGESVPSILSASCDSALGLQTQAIPESNLIATSFYDLSHTPHHARLHGNQSWIPTTANESSPTEFLQLMLNKRAQVVGVALQGGGTDSPYWVTNFTTSFSDDGVKFSASKKYYAGNTNATSVVRANFDSPQETRFVRISPLQWHGLLIAMRLELYGCYL